MVFPFGRNRTDEPAEPRPRTAEDAAPPALSPPAARPSSPLSSALMRAASQAPLDAVGLPQRPDAKADAADMKVDVEDEGGADAASSYRPFWWQHPEWMGAERAEPAPDAAPPAAPPPSTVSRPGPVPEPVAPRPARDAGTVMPPARDSPARPVSSAFARAAATEPRLASGVEPPVPAARPAPVPPQPAPPTPAPRAPAVAEDEDGLLREADAVLGWLQAPQERPIDILTARIESLHGVILRQTQELAAVRAEAARLAEESSRARTEAARLAEEASRARDESARLAEEAARMRDENVRLRATLRSLVEAARLDRDRQETASQALNKLAESLPR